MARRITSISAVDMFQSDHRRPFPGTWRPSGMPGSTIGLVARARGFATQRAYARRLGLIVMVLIVMAEIALALLFAGEANLPVKRTGHVANGMAKSLVFGYGSCHFNA